MSLRKRIVVGVLLLLVLSGVGFYLWQHHNPSTYNDDKVHVHADFLIVINDQELDLSDAKYQSSTEQELHRHIHLHDGDDHVVHRHADNITFAEFLESLDFTLTNDCLTNDIGERFCTNESTVLALYVNHVPQTVLTTYVPQEEDQILLYYGIRDNPKLSEYLNNVTDESCIYSGTCPERGTAPPESCGLTCEI